MDNDAGGADRANDASSRTNTTRDTPFETAEHLAEADLSSDDLASLRPIRQQCDSLVRTETVDKDTALQVLHIQHAMETHILNLRYSLSKEAEALRNELTVLKLTHTQAAAIDNLTQDSVRTKRDLRELSGNVESASSQLGVVTKKLADMEARIATLFSGKRR